MTTTHRQIGLETLHQVAERMGIDTDDVGTFSVRGEPKHAPGFVIDDLNQAFTIFAIFGQAQFGDTEIEEELDAGELAEDAEIDALGKRKLLYFHGWNVTA